MACNVLDLASIDLDSDKFLGVVKKKCMILVLQNVNYAIGTNV